MAHRAVTDIEIRRCIHDLQNRLGTIRLAVSSVVEGSLDDEGRTWMLSTASEETLRASADLSAISALVTCSLDRARLTDIDVGHALRHAVEATGSSAEVKARGSLVARARSRSVEVGLAAMFRLFAAGGDDLVVTVRRRRGAIAIELAGADTELPALELLFTTLISAMGATAIASNAGTVAFSLPGAAA